MSDATTMDLSARAGGRSEAAATTSDGSPQPTAPETAVAANKTPAQARPARRQPASTAPDPADRLASVSQVLRAFGAFLVVAATSTFMLQHWNDGSDVTRYLTLLGLTGTLAVAGFICGIGVREARGARTLLALVITAVPIHFAVLGGLLQSQFPWDQVMSATAPWNAQAPESALMLTGIGLTVLLPLTWLSMKALARPHALWLAGALLLANLPVLIPIRDPGLVGWLIAGMLVMVSVIEQRAAKLGYAMHTLEGRFIRLMMVVPVVVVTSRALLWYEPTFLFIGLAVVSSALAAFAWVPKAGRNASEVAALQGVLATLAVIGWVFLGRAIVDALVPPQELILLMFGLPAAALLMFLSTRCVSAGAGYRLAAVLIAVGSALLNAIAYWNVSQVSIAGLACLLTGIAALAYGIMSERKIPLGLGALAALVGFLELLIAAIEFEHLLHWGSLAGIGIALIFVAAFCERYAKRMLAYAEMLHTRVREWQY